MSQNLISLLKNCPTQYTKKFYDILFSENPELLSVFNKTNQENGMQSEALAKFIRFWANTIENYSEKFINRMKEVAEKHVSLQIKAEDYPKVGKALIKAIGSVYDLTEEETNLLLASYKKLSGLFIEIENNRYNQIQESGGWEDYKEFIIAEKTLANIKGDTISLTLKTVNGEKVLPHKPEQYITMQVNGVQRHFTITDSGEDYYKLLIKVKEVTDNDSFSVTQYLRDAEMNTIVGLRPPCGIPNKSNPRRKQRGILEES